MNTYYYTIHIDPFFSPLNKYNAFLQGIKRNEKRKRKKEDGNYPFTLLIVNKKI